MTRSGAIAGRMFTVLIAALCTCLVFAGPASACTAGSGTDDGTAEATADLDYVDDTMIKTLAAPTTLVNTATWLYIDGSAYGGCGLYALVVNGALDHNFDTCQVGWDNQPVTVPLAAGPNTFEIRDIDLTWDTGIYMSVDTDSGIPEDTIVVNGGGPTGKLMWRLNVSALVCL